MHQWYYWGIKNVMTQKSNINSHTSKQQLTQIDKFSLHYPIHKVTTFTEMKLC